MTVLQFLSKGRRLTCRIEARKAEIENLRIISRSVKSVTYDKPYVTGSRNYTDATFVKYLTMIDERERKLAKDLEEMVGLLNDIDDAIRKVPGTDYQLILTFKYLCDYSWDEIREKMHLSKSTLKRYHSRALSMVEVPEKYQGEGSERKNEMEGKTSR